MKNTDTADDQEELEEEKEVEIDDDIGAGPGGPKMTQLNGPVLDPTFIGRGEVTFAAKFRKITKKKV